MTTLAVSRALVTSTNPTETQLDSMRTSLLTFFNAASLDQNNVATGAMLLSSLSDPGDDLSVHWTSSHATLTYDNSNDKFKIQNTQGSIVFGVRVVTTLTEYMELRSTDGALDLAGQLYINTGVGAQDVSLLWLLSRYRKPRLTYTDNDIVTVENNTTGIALVMMRDRACTVFDTTMSLAATANGYVNTDTGTAVSGLANGLTRTANRWYFCYAVRVQYGTQAAAGTYAIIVAHTTGPDSGNIATLNTAFGTGEWVYMGMIRNGYNDGTSTNIIVPFIYDEGGYLRFTKGTAAEGAGVTLASSSASTADLSYDLVFGNSAAATIPATVSRALVSGYRSKNGTEFYYRSISTLENNQQVTGLHHVGSTLTTLIPVLHMDIPMITNYRLVVANYDATSSNMRITLVGVLDHNV